MNEKLNNNINNNSSPQPIMPNINNNQSLNYNVQQVQNPINNVSNNNAASNNIQMNNNAVISSNTKTTNNQVPATSSPMGETSQSATNENEILKSHVKRRKGPHIFFLFIELIIIGLGIYFLIQANEKYKTYIVIGADFFSQEKVYEAGKPYYKAKYVYKVNDKKYYYDYPEKFEQTPDQVIQIRYNPQNPSDIYSEKQFLFFIIVIATGAILLFITIGILISISSKKKEKIITVIVEDILTCVGGRKIYMRNINTPVDDNNPQNTEYYSYYTNQLEKFPIGQKLKFNVYKYAEVLTTEVYKDKFISNTINDFSPDDFIIIK